MNKAIGMLILSVVLWGMTIAPTKWAMESVHPFTLTFLRLFLASLLFVPFTWMRAKKAGGVIRIPWKRMSMLSFTGVSGYFLFGTYGISLTSGVNASILSASLPLFTIIFAAVYLKERIRTPQWLGILLGIVGVLIISVQSNQGSNGSLLGDILVLTSCFIWAIYVVQMKRPQDEAELPSELFTALTLMLGAIMLVPFAAVETWMVGLPPLPLKGWLSLGYLVLGSSIAAYWLWNKALESVSAASAGVYLNTLPLVSVLTAIVLLNEAVTWRTILGGSFILIGVFWAERYKAASNSVTDLTEQA